MGRLPRHTWLVDAGLHLSCDDCLCTDPVMEHLSRKVSTSIRSTQTYSIDSGSSPADSNHLLRNRDAIYYTMGSTR